MRKAFGVGVGAVVGGCSLFGFDGFSGGDVPAEAGADRSSTSDAPNAPGGDANAGDAMPSGPFCKTLGSGAALCDDFEEPGTFTGRWPAQDKYLGTMDVVDGIGMGGGRGLRVSVTPKADGQPGQDGVVILGWESGSKATFVDAEVAVKLASVPSTTYMAGPLYVESDRAAGGRARVGFIFDGKRDLTTNPVVFDSNDQVVSSSESKLVTTLPIGTWVRIRIVLDLAKSPAALFCYVDGALKVEQQIVGFEQANVHVYIGSLYVGTIDGGTIDYDLDDARVSWK